MIQFLLRKIWKNKWMMVCLLVGNLLLIGIVAATPLYINATMRRILYQDMRNFQIENEEHPAVMSLQFTFNNAAPETRIQAYLDAMFVYAPGMAEDLGVPVAASIRRDVMTSWHLFPYPPREVHVPPRSMNLAGISDAFDHVEIVHGRLPSHEFIGGNTIEAIITEQTMIRSNILLNETLTVGNVSHPNEPLYVHIVGIYEPAAHADGFWATLGHNHHAGYILVSDDLIQRHFIYHYHVDFRTNTTWFHVFDHSAMTSRDVPHYLAVLEEYHTRFEGIGVRRQWIFTENFSETILQHTERADRLAVTLWVLQVPIYVLLAFYIYMVSRQILKLDQNEISVLKSRGAGRGQILGLYAMQGFFVAVICYPIGIAIGVFICRVLGASSGFLELVQRTAIVVEVTPDALLFAALAMLVSFLTMFLPVIRFSKVGIVDHKRSRSGKLLKPFWQRFFLDIVCLGVSIYALYTFNARREAMALMVRHNQSVDPLLFISSSLFIMGLGLLCLRLFPHAVKLVFTLGRRLWSPATYASLIRVIRSAGEEQFIMIFLLFTLSVGTFSAQAARTINLNSDHQIRYLTGADLTFNEVWRRDWRGAAGEEGTDMVVFIEPDFERFTNFEEVEALTRVQRQYVDIRPTAAIGFMGGVRLMAIETDSFGETAWFRGDLLPGHLNHFLNALANRSDGILLSDNFRTLNDISLGDTILFADEFGNAARGVVVGFVEHFPTFSPVSRTEIDGAVLELPQSLIVANLGHLQTQWGPQPYQVWMRTNTPSNRFFYDFTEENRLNLVTFNDADAALIESRSDPILQGTNGVLTVGFIVTLLICFTGFLIYWFLSLRARVLQFGIFRAMGMGMRSLIGLLVNEQLLITFTAIALGALVGEISARLFVPLIQISYTAADQVIPLMIVNEARDYMNLYIVVGAMIVICLSVLGVYISRIKITQALKLGED